MKNLMAKIKTLDYKQFALQHGEKIGLGVVGLIALVCLGMTNWASTYTGTPESMETKADEMARKLTANRWPETAKAEFLPLKDAETELTRVIAEVPLKRFEWEEGMSPKLYQPKIAAEEPDLTSVSELYAFTGKMPMAVAASQSSLDEPAEEPEVKKPAKGKKGSKKNDADDLLKGPMGGMMPGSAGGGAFGAVSSEKARGVRFNVIVGVVNAQQQYKQLQKALHLDFLHQAKNHLVYADFKIQRQRAVPGPDPWTGPWKDVSTDTSIDVLMNEASDFDPEVVSLNYTNVAFTSPLPHRLDEDWDTRQVVHPKIPTLTEDELERQDQEMRAVNEISVGEEEGASTGARGRGFRKVQKDALGTRDKVMSREGGMKDVQDAVRKRNSSSGSGMAPPGAGPGGGRMGPQGGMMGGGMGGNAMTYGAGAGSGEGNADLLLFRYFDFDVEPGECYRYRVQLVVENPSYGETFVKSPIVAEGEFRESPWSTPSTAIAVEKDVDYALSKVLERGGVVTGAELNVVQFDPNVGTFISDTFPVKYGAYVGAVKKSLHLELAPPDLKEEEVTFSSKDVLLDSSAAPKLSASAAADLKLSDRQKNDLKKNGDLDLAVTLNRFGEIVDLDGESKQDLKLALDKVKEERKDYEGINENRKKATKDAKAAEKESKKGKKGRRGRSRGKSPLKSDASSMMPGGAAMPGGGAMPGMSPPGAGKAR